MDVKTGSKWQQSTYRRCKHTPKPEGQRMKSRNAETEQQHIREMKGKKSRSYVAQHASANVCAENRLEVRRHSMKEDTTAILHV